MNDLTFPTVAILGGTGAEGRGLALRWAAAGIPVIIGSRDGARAAEAAATLGAALGSADGVDRAAPADTHRPVPAAPRGTDNLSAAAAADVIVLAVPYAAQAETLAAIRPAIEGKLLIDVAVPLRPPKVSVVQLPAAGSAAAEAQAQLGPGVTVVAAFQNVAAGKLAVLGAEVACDVLVCGDDAAAKALTLRLAEAAGLTAYDAGPLANAGVVDGFTSILIGINRRHGTTSAGLRITNIPRPGADSAPA